MTYDDLYLQVDSDRLARLALELVAIPSPTGDSRRVAEVYADRLRELGLTVTFDEALPESPSVIAYLEGAHPGPTLEVAGHLDVIPVPHDPPEIRDGILYGRGACDMKGSLAAALEAARVLATARASLHGRLMICVYGYHEAPLGRGQNLTRLLERGIRGDAVIVVEGAADSVGVIHKGMSTFEILIERQGEPYHEVQAPPGTPHPLLIGLDVANMLRAWNEELRRGEDLPYVGPESVFMGQFECGDFYNRVPTRCRIVGTRRYAPHKRFPEVEAEFQARLAPIRERSGVSIQLDLVKAKDGFRVREDEPLVRTLQAAYLEVTGRSLPAAGMKAVADAADFVNDGGVPACYFGVGLERGHATPEYVALSRLEQLARVLVATAVRFLGSATSTQE
jgi:acetylornithine deacetylase/succinyl-diaminopimelate desuccinylase-like protein